MEKVEKYINVNYNLPKEQLTWPLYGVGLENMGKGGKPVKAKVPKHRDDELLVRCDATGLCFSDIKILKQGGEHVRIHRDIAKEPVIMGHESVVTVVEVGKKLRDKYNVGDRFVVQADIYVNGESTAYGYALPGALMQYQLIGKEILDGDDGCYLIPIKDSTSYAQAALTEPWACVVHSYMIDYRTTLKDGGKLLIVCGEGAEDITLGNILKERNPEMINVVNLSKKLKSELLAADRVDYNDIDFQFVVQCDCLADDIIVLGYLSDEDLAIVFSKLNNGSTLNIVCDKPRNGKVPVDVGRIHYNNWYYTGNSKNDASLSYGGLGRKFTELKAGGTAWLLGAGGPMGQMHVQRACEMPNGPRLIVATDIDETRLNELKERFIPAAEANGRKLLVLNPKDYSSEEEFEKELESYVNNKGYDDVIALVPIAALIQQATRHVADNGLLNIFAGVVRGTMCDLDLDDINLRSIHWVGCSGSFISDMKETLRMTEEGEIYTENAAVAIGGFNAVIEGLKKVEAQQVPGKIIIYQQIPDMPVTLIKDIAKEYPTIAPLLRDGKYWTFEAEKELLKLKAEF